MTKQDSELEIDDISGYKTCAYDREWCHSCVLEVDIKNEVKVSFLHLRGPSRSFMFPSIQDITQLTYLTPNTVAGHVYTLTLREKKAATVKLPTMH